MEKDIKTLLDESAEAALGVVGSPSSSFEVNIDIKDVSEKSKLLGELAGFCVPEDDRTVFVLGQITEIFTRNRWHEEPAFKGIIKRHGNLPNLSGVADNRIAKINVQSSFVLQDDAPAPHKLANSPSTGIPACRINNEMMETLMAGKENLVCLGKAYDTDVNVPFWFKHFGAPEKNGVGEAYHIGVFGRTGSGKTTAAANMLLGYAQHTNYMNILILDPQEQFYKDNKVLPDGKFQEEAKKLGMKCVPYKLPKEVVLPGDARLLSDLLWNYDFIKTAFDILTEEKQREMRDAIARYVEERLKHGRPLNDPKKLYTDMLKYFLNDGGEEEREPLKRVYSTKSKIEEVKGSIRDTLKKNRGLDMWGKVCSLFVEGNGKTLLDDIIAEIVNDSESGGGKLIVLNISGRGASHGMDGLETFYVKLIEDAIRRKGADLYAKGKQANCLIVMDEAHRYISTSSYEGETKELTTSIIDSVRTTRKYGIGYMFITQTIESLHAEIRQQIRIFAFGYGLTSGTEFSKIRDIINDETSAKFYRSFIDPASNGKYPFMFYGPISPLSFTGMPLFLEMQGKISDFPAKDDEALPQDK